MKYITALTTIWKHYAHNFTPVWTSTYQQHLSNKTKFTKIKIYL